MIETTLVITHHVIINRQNPVFLQVNTAYVVKSTEAFKQWEYRSKNDKRKGENRRRGDDESPIIELDDDDDDDEDDDEERENSPVIEEPTCPFKKSNEDEEVG